MTAPPSAPPAAPPAPPPAAAVSHAADAGRPAFRLLRYFTIATLLAFGVVAVVLVVLQRGEEAYFDRVQQEQRSFLKQAQASLAQQQQAAARASLLAVHEASHVNLTRLVANLLWSSDFGPFVARAQSVPVAACRALPAEPREPRRACQAEVGARIRALPGFAALDAKAYAAMTHTSVFKIKVFDLRGITVYSSEHVQVGEDGALNAGWQAAAQGRPASELTHRDRFSAFERVVENRDLISTYVPVRAAGADTVLGVVELYSDVTPFLQQIRGASDRFAAISGANEAAVAARSADHQQQVLDSSDQFLVIVIGLLTLLYGVSLLIVWHGQRQIDRQALAEQQAMQREQLWHREKMAALATLAANVSHEVGNPLAIIAGLAQQLPPPPPGEPSPVGQILAQTSRVGAMMRRISDFASSRGEVPECVDVNPLLQALCDFHAFDRRLRGVPVRFEPGQGLPACQVVPDHFNEVMMALLQAVAEAAPQAGAALVVRSVADGAAVRVEVDTAGLTLDASRLQAVQRRAAGMGARLAIEPGRTQLLLPPAARTEP